MTAGVQTRAIYTNCTVKGMVQRDAESNHSQHHREHDQRKKVPYFFVSLGSKHLRTTLSCVKQLLPWWLPPAVLLSLLRW